MKWLFLLFMISVSFVAGADESESNRAIPLDEMENLSDYIVERLDQEDVNCSNIMSFISAYFKLSTANQLYLNVYANRFLDVVYEADKPAQGSAISAPSTGGVEPQPAQEDPYTCMGSDVDIKEDIACAVELIAENEITLSDQAYVIQEVLPHCLKAPATK